MKGKGAERRFDEGSGDLFCHDRTTAARSNPLSLFVLRGLRIDKTFLKKTTPKLQNSFGRKNLAEIFCRVDSTAGFNPKRHKQICRGSKSSIF